MGIFLLRAGAAQPYMKCSEVLVQPCFDADLVSGRTNGADGPAPPGRKLLQAGRFSMLSEHKPVAGLGKDMYAK